MCFLYVFVCVNPRSRCCLGLASRAVDWRPTAMGSSDAKRTIVCVMHWDAVQPPDIVWLLCALESASVARSQTVSRPRPLRVLLCVLCAVQKDILPSVPALTLSVRNMDIHGHLTTMKEIGKGEGNEKSGTCCCKVGFPLYSPLRSVIRFATQKLSAARRQGEWLQRSSWSPRILGARRPDCTCVRSRSASRSRSW